MKENFIDFKSIDAEETIIKRNKFNYQYNYDSFIIWINKNIECDNTVYSDRLLQWNYYKYNKYCKEIWNNESQYFYNREPKEIEKFLCLYLGKKLN